MYIALVVYIQEFLQAKLNYLNNRWASIFTHQLFHSFRNFPKTFQRYSINIIMMLLLHTFSWEISYRLLWSQHVNVLHSSIWRNYHWNHQHRVRDGNTYVTWFYVAIGPTDRSWRPRRGDFDSIQGFLLTHDENRIRKFLVSMATRICGD